MPTTKKAASGSATGDSDRVTQYIAQLGGWRGQTMTKLRKLVLAAAPGITEVWKWDTPVYAAKSNIVALGVFQDHVKLNFFKGASLVDPQHLFNAGLEAKTSRGIDIYQNDKLNEPALKELVRAAVAADGGAKKK